MLPWGQLLLDPVHPSPAAGAALLLHGYLDTTFNCSAKCLTYGRYRLKVAIDEVEVVDIIIILICKLQFKTPQTRQISARNIK